MTVRNSALNARLEMVVYAEFDSLTMPLVLFERLYEFVFIGARLKARLSPDGQLMDGVVGGGYPGKPSPDCRRRTKPGRLYETVNWSSPAWRHAHGDRGMRWSLLCFEFLLPVFVYPEKWIAMPVETGSANPLSPRNLPGGLLSRLR